MKVVCSSRGSRGDVLPIVHIASALKKAGHDVLVCVPPLFEPTARERALNCRLYSEDSLALMQGFGAGWQGARNALRWFSRSLDEQFDLLLPATDDADALVTSANEVAAPTVARYRRIPHYRVAYAPIIPGSQPPPLQPYQRLPEWINRAMWFALSNSLHLLFGPKLNRKRRQLGLGRVWDMASYVAGSSHTLLAISSNLAPRGRGWRYPHSYIGYPYSDDDGSLDPALERFLDAGPPPVYIGFGSVNVKDPKRFTRMVLDAVNFAGCRAVISRGWTGLGDASVSEDVFLCDDVPHATLFPRLSGVAHHGGSGTVHNAARAGIPQFVMPQIADQYFWAHRIHELGLGPAPVSPADLTLVQLIEALRAIAGRPIHSERARAMSQVMGHEHGVPAAVRIITARHT